MSRVIRSSALSTDAAVCGWFAAYLILLLLDDRTASGRVVYGALVFLLVAWAVQATRMRVMITGEEITVVNMWRRFRVSRAEVVAVETTTASPRGTVARLRSRDGGVMRVDAIVLGARPGSRRYERGLADVAELAEALGLPAPAETRETTVGARSGRFLAVQWGLWILQAALLVTVLLIEPRVALWLVPAFVVGVVFGPLLLDRIALADYRDRVVLHPASHVGRPSE